VEVDKLKGPLSNETLVSIVFDLMAGGRDIVAEERQAGAMAGWEMFLAAFRRGIGRGVLLLPHADLARLGNLYEATWRSKGKVLTKLIRVKGVGSGPRGDTPIVRYWPMSATTIRPVIELRCLLDNLLRVHPEAQGYAHHWRVTSPVGSRHTIGAAAFGVSQEYVPAVARLAATALHNGLMRGVHVSPKGVLVVRPKGGGAKTEPVPVRVQYRLQDSGPRSYTCAGYPEHFRRGVTYCTSDPEMIAWLRQQKGVFDIQLG
jgi:hypothetical protein